MDKQVAPKDIVNVQTIQGNKTDHANSTMTDTHTVLFAQALTDILLKNAVAQVSSGIFYNRKLAEELNLEINGHEIVNLSGFGDKTENTRVTLTVTIYLLTDDKKKFP